MRSWPRPVIPDLVAVAALPPLALFDSSTGTVRPTAPGPVATLYVCGITPYDATHLGHAATYLAFDLVQRYWLAAGHRVDYVQNITDVDDPLLERAERDRIDWRELADAQIQLFRDDMTALRVLPPKSYIGVVEAMDDISAAVARLLESGAAYRVPDDKYPDIYFDITATGRFGYVSGYDADTMRTLFAERGGDPDRVGKRNALDPLLWQMARPGEPAWESAVGPGRAGWHVECTVIAFDRLGMGIDLQGGGSDLIFPHHECSAAHAEALTGQPRFAQHYTHAAMIGLDSEKMSKSRGNLVFVSRLRAEGVDPMAVRVALLSGHYRQDREWTGDALPRAQARLAAWRSATARPGSSGDVLAQVIRALSDDLDTPTAFAALDAWATDDRAGGVGVASALDALLGVA